MTFFAKLEDAWLSRGTALCVGLDPRLRVGESVSSMYDAVMRLVQATAPWAACYKPNAAFYEAHGAEGLAILERVIKAASGYAPVVLDAKRCDIGPTAEAYATACFRALGAEAVTLSPYMGRDAVDPFLEYPDACVFLLARTSNPRASAFQDLDIGGAPLYARVAAECASWSDRVGLVAAGNDPVGLAAVRKAAPRAWLLAPGIGAQGGDIAEAYAAGARDDGMGILPVAARSVAEATDPAAAARALVDAMRRAADSRAADSRAGRNAGSRSDEPARNAGLKRSIMKGLVNTGCFKTGSFTLKSGKVSPFYVDLRRVISDPVLLDAVASAYAQAAAGASFDRIAGIPAAALPLATAVSLKMGKPMVWPRMPAKDHGTGVKVEGEFKPGERVLLLDDLITTGASKLEAIAILRGEGLVVDRLVVLIERGRQGRRDMEAAGVNLAAFFHVRELFALCEGLGVINSSDRLAMEAYADAE